MCISTSLIASDILTNSKYQFEHFGLNDGVISNEVYDLHQDESGFIWACTDDGVIRYDGYRFHTFDSMFPSSSKTVFKAFELGSYLWFNLYDGNLLKFSKKTFDFKELKENAPNSTGNWIYDIFQKNGLIHFIYQFGESYSVLRNGIREVYQVKESEINWLCKHDEKNIYSVGSLEDFVLIKDARNQSGYLRKKITFANYSLFFLDSTIYYLDNLGIIKNIKAPGKIIEIKVIDQQVFICGHNGLYIMNLDLKRFYQVFDGGSTDIIRDRDGIYWISTLNSGILKLTSFLKMKINFNLPDRTAITDMTVFENHLILGTATGQFVAISPYTEKPVLFDSLSGKSYIHTFNLSKNTLYINGEAALSVKNAQLYLSRLPAKDDPKLFIADQYLFRYNQTSGYTVKDLSNKGLPGTQCLFEHKILDLTYDQKKLIYVSTFDGIYVINTDNPCSPSELLPQSIPKVRINKVLVCTDLVVIGTDHSGIYIVKEGKLVYHLNNLTSIPKDLAIINSDKLLVGTNDGIIEYTIADRKNAPRLVLKDRYSTKDLLISNFIYSLAYWKNHVYYSTDKGISRFEIPTKIIKPAIPLVYIMSINVGGNALQSDLHGLKHDQNDITIKILGISSSKPMRNFYRYQIIHNNDTSFFRYTDSRELSLNNLQPGKYKVVIAARNHKNLWSTNQYVEFSIIPKLAKRIWFQVSLTLILLSLFVLFILYRFNRLKLQQIEQNKMYELQRKYMDTELSSLKSQFKPHFIFNALQSIHVFIMKNRSDIAGEYLNTFAKLMRTSLQFSSLEFISIQDEVTFLHSYLNIEQLRFPDRFNYTIEVDENLYEEEVMMPPLIIQPFCENAIKHAFESDDPNNHISIVLKLNKNMKSIYCRIKDNGLGLPDKSEFINSHQSKGIDLIRKRIELLVSKYGFGTLNIEVDKGLLVELNLPIE